MGDCIHHWEVVIEDGMEVGTCIKCTLQKTFRACKDDIDIHYGLRSINTQRRPVTDNTCYFGPYKGGVPGVRFSGYTHPRRISETNPLWDNGVKILEG